MNKKRKTEPVEQISKKVGSLMLDKKARDIILLDVREVTPMTDFFILCTAESHPQARAIKNHIEDELIKEEIKPWHIEGIQSMEWILMDYVNIVINVFSPEAREFYNLERLWGDAIVTEISDEGKE
jgi:ribosome-associated protein